MLAAPDGFTENRNREQLDAGRHMLFNSSTQLTKIVNFNVAGLAACKHAVAFLASSECKRNKF